MRKIEIEVTPEQAEMLQELAEIRGQDISETIIDAIREGLKLHDRKKD